MSSARAGARDQLARWGTSLLETHYRRAVRFGDLELHARGTE